MQPPPFLRVLPFTEKYRILKCLSVAWICLWLHHSPSLFGQGATVQWKANANGTWSNPSNWEGSLWPSEWVDMILMRYDITSNRTVSVDGYYSFRELVLGDTNSTQTFTINATNGGVITLDSNDEENPIAIIRKEAGGGNDVISAPIVLNSMVQFYLNNETSGRTLSLTGLISEGYSSYAPVVGDVALELYSPTYTSTRNQILSIGGAQNNTFQGKIVVYEGTLRSEGDGTATLFGAGGVGNETVIHSGARLDLRGHDFNANNSAGVTEIFHLSGSGWRGLGALVSSSSNSSSLSHIVLDGNTTVGGSYTITLNGYNQTGETDQFISGILEANGNELTKVGIGDFTLTNTDIRNLQTLVIREGRVRLLGTSTLDAGTKVYLGSNRGVYQGHTLALNQHGHYAPFDGKDFTFGSRTQIDVNTLDIGTASYYSARLDFNGHDQQTFDLEMYWSRGWIERSASTTAAVGNSFTTTFTGIINMVGGEAHENVFNITGGTDAAVNNFYQHPGRVILESVLDNTSQGNLGKGFTKRGNRELRIVGDQDRFNGEVIVAGSVPRSNPMSNNITTKDPESQYFNLALADQGRLANASKISLTSGGSITLLNTVNHNDRINDDGTLYLSAGFFQQITGLERNEENWGNAVALRGKNSFFIDTRAGGAAHNHFKSIQIQEGAAMVFYNLGSTSSFGSSAADDVRISIADSTSLNVVGDPLSQGTKKAVVTGMIGGTSPRFSENGTLEGAMAWSAGAANFMTLDGVDGVQYLRPLTESESTTTLSDGVNWVIDAANSSNTAFANPPNVSESTRINSLRIANQSLSTTSNAYLTLEQGKQLTIDSGMILVAHYGEATSANFETVLRGYGGSSINFNQQKAWIHAGSTYLDTDATSGTWSSYLPTNNVIVRASMKGADGLMATGRGYVILENANEFHGHSFVNESRLYLRHDKALQGSESVTLNGAGQLYLDRGVNIKGLNVIANSPTSHAFLYNNFAQAASLQGDLIIHGVDLAGTITPEFRIDGATETTINLYGNIYGTTLPDYFIDNDVQNNPRLVAVTSASGAANGNNVTLNLFGKFQDRIDGALDLPSLPRGDSPGESYDVMHLMRFQVKGGSEVNVNAFNQWDSSGQLDIFNGHFRVMYDPAEIAGGFFTDAAVAGWYGGSGRTIADLTNNYYHRTSLGGPAASGTSVASGGETYASTLMLTKSGQVFNNPNLYFYNNNRNGALTIGGENNSGTVYYGSAISNGSAEARAFFENQGTERDIRLYQREGGTSEYNLRFVDGGTSVLASISKIGLGTARLVDNVHGASSVERWNIMAGTMQWQFTQNAADRFAISTAALMLGGGNLEVIANPALTTARGQSLTGVLRILKGSSGISVVRPTGATNVATTLTLGSTTNLTRRDVGSTLHFETIAGGGQSYIVLNGLHSPGSSGGIANPSLTYNTVVSWATHGTAKGVVNDFAYVDSTNSNRVVGASTKSNAYQTDASSLNASLWGEVSQNWISETASLGLSGTLAQNGSISGLRLLRAGNSTLQIEAERTLTLREGAILNATATGESTKAILGGNLTSTYRNLSNANETELIIHQYSSQGLLRIGSNLVDSASGVAMNFVHTGTGSTVLEGDNTHTGTNYLLGGKVVIDRDERLGASQSGIYFDGGTLRATQSFNLNESRAITIGGDGAIFEVDRGVQLGLSGNLVGDSSAINAANGYTTANVTNNPFYGDVIKTGLGELVWGGSNNNENFRGLVTVREGTLTLAPTFGADTALATFIGTNHSFLDGIYVENGGTLNLQASGTFTTSEWITLNGLGSQGAGAMRTTGTARTYRFNGQLHLESDSLINITNAATISLNYTSGTISGKGNLLRTGNGTLYLYGNSTEYKGSLILAGGSTLLRDDASKLINVESIRMTREAIFQVDNEAASNNPYSNRVNDQADLFMSTGSRLRVNSNNVNLHSGLEYFGNLHVTGGFARLQQYNNSALTATGISESPQYSGMVFNQIRRSEGAIIKFNLLEVGGKFADSTFGSSTFKNVMVFGVRDKSNLDIVGGDGSRKTNQAILRGMFGGAYVERLSGTTLRDAESSMNRDLMTVETAVDPLSGETIHVIRALRDDEYLKYRVPLDGNFSADFLSSSLDGLNIQSDDNLKLAGRSSSQSNPLTPNLKTTMYFLTQDTTVNSLTMANESWHYLNTASPAESAIGERSILFLGDGVTMKIESGMMNFANLSFLDRAGQATGTNVMAQHSYVQGGKLDFLGKEAVINTSGSWMYYNYSGNTNLYSALQTGNSDVYLYSKITNANGLIKTGTRNLILGGMNSYTGTTYVTEGNLYIRHEKALGQSGRVELSGSGALIVSEGIHIKDVDVRIGQLIAGNRNGLVFESGSAWSGNVIVDDVDEAGQAGVVSAVTQRNIIRAASTIATLYGNIYAEHQHQILGAAGTTSKLVATTGMSDGVLYLKGKFSDTIHGALDAPVTRENQNEVLRFEVGTVGAVAYSATSLRSNEEGAVWVDQAWDSVGRIGIDAGAMHFLGEGNFWTAKAQQNMNDLNEMSGFHLGGDVSSATDKNHNAAFYLTKDGQVFNIGNIGVGLENGLGNIHGNSTLGGLNIDGKVQYGLGTGSVYFDNALTVAYDRDLRFYQAAGGEMDVNFNFVDGGNLVTSSITKVGLGTTYLRGSSAGASSLENVYVQAGELRLSNYGQYANTRLGSQAEVYFGGGSLYHMGDANFTEQLNRLILKSGGSQLVAAQNGKFEIAQALSREAGATIHFHTTENGVIQLAGTQAGKVLGGYATFGSDSGDRRASAFASTDASGRVVAYQHGVEEADSFGVGLHTLVESDGLVGGETETLTFRGSAGSITSGNVVLRQGAVLFADSFAGGETLGELVTLSTSASQSELFIHNHSLNDVILRSQILSPSNLIFTGKGVTHLQANITGHQRVAIQGGSTLKLDTLARFGAAPTSLVNEYLYLNDGRLVITNSGDHVLDANQGIMLGSGGGTFHVDHANGKLVFLGGINVESSPIQSYADNKPVNSNPMAGELRLSGAGTFQFGDYNASSPAQDNRGIRATNITGLTTIGDGIIQTQVLLRGSPASNAYIWPFGTHAGFEDGTNIKNESAFRFQFQMGDSASATNGYVRLLEWMTFGEKASDVTYLYQDSARQVEMMGNTRVHGTLYIHTQNGGQDTRNTFTNGSLDFAINSGYGGQILGDHQSRIIKTGAGTMSLRESSQHFEGTIELRRGALSLYGYGAVAGVGETIYLGDHTYNPNNYGTRTLTLYQMSSNSINDVAVEIEDLHLYQNIEVYGADVLGTSVDNTLRAYLYSDEASAHFHGHVRIHSTFGTDKRGLNLSIIGANTVDPATTGRTEQIYMFLHGNIIDATANKDSILRMNYSDTTSVNVGEATFVLGGDNSGWKGILRLSPDNNGTTVDESERLIVRLHNDLALTASNEVTMYDYTTLQVAGSNVTMGSLNTTNGGTGRWQQDNVTTLLSSTTVENAAKTDGYLTITENTDIVWHSMFRDGVTPVYFDDRKGGDGALHLIKAGTGRATLIQSNTYTGTTEVSAGNLQVGTGIANGTRASANGTGFTGFGATIVKAGATLSGTGVVQGTSATQHVIHGKLQPGDNGGALMGTLHIDGNLRIASGGSMKFEISLPHKFTGLAWAVLATPEDPQYASKLLELGSDSVWQGAVTSTQYDHVELSGMLSFDTGSHVEVVGAQAQVITNLAVGDAFNLIDWGTVGGSRNMELILPTLQAGLVWETSLFNSHGILLVAAIPEPSRMLLLLLAFGGVTLRRRR